MVNTSAARLKSLFRRMKWSKTIPNLVTWIIPYYRGVKIQRWWLGKPWVQNIFFLKKVKLLKQNFSQVGESVPDPENSILCSLMSNTWTNWRWAAFKKVDITAWSVMLGKENLTKALSEGKGVILVTTHTFRTNLLKSILHTHAKEEVFFVHKFFASNDRSQQITAYARQLADALKVLKSGGVLCIAGDGSMGEGGFLIPFFGRVLTFRSGFADMSIRSGAPVLPVYEYLQSDGRVVLEFGSQLLPAGDTRENQIESIVRQYACSLSDHWIKLIPSLSWFKLQQFLVEPGRENESGSSETLTE